MTVAVRADGVILVAPTVVVAVVAGIEKAHLGGRGLKPAHQAVNYRTGGQHQDAGHQQRLGQPFQKPRKLRRENHVCAELDRVGPNDQCAAASASRRSARACMVIDQAD